MLVYKHRLLEATGNKKTKKMTVEMWGLAVASYS
jgi:hypothetical protein